MRVYHIDRGHRLYDGQVIDLERHNAKYPNQLKYIDALFQDGKVVMLGHICTYPNYGDIKDNSQHRHISTRQRAAKVPRPRRIMECSRAGRESKKLTACAGNRNCSAC